MQKWVFGKSQSKNNGHSRKHNAVEISTMKAQEAADVDPVLALDVGTLTA